MGQNITYAPRSAIKSQVLADFVAEWTEIETPPASIEHEIWTKYFDDLVMKEGAGVGLVFISLLGVRIEYMVRLHFSASNNTAEHKALINGLRITVELRIKRLEIRGDSELVVDKVMKDKNCVDPKMAAYCQAVQDLEGKFHGLELHHVLRDYNKTADVLAKAASSRSSVPHGVFASEQHEPSVRAELHHVLRDYNKTADVLAKAASSRSSVPHGVFASEQHEPSVRAEGEKPPEELEPEVMAIDQPPEVNLKHPDWWFPIFEWLVEGKLPFDQTEARCITR
jgi:ribonuclease HI